MCRSVFPDLERKFVPCYIVINEGRTLRDNSISSSAPVIFIIEIDEIIERMITGWPPSSTTRRYYTNFGDTISPHCLHTR